MSELSYAIDRLTMPWEYVLLGKKAPDGVKFIRTMPPLLDILDSMTGSSTGASNGGGGALFRVPVNLEALTLQETISGSVDAWNLDLGHLAHGGLASRTRQLGDQIERAHLGGKLDDGEYDHLVEMVKRWCEKIMEQIEGWHDREYKVPCPKCHHSKVNNGTDGADRWALHLRYRDKQCKAECLRCHHEWIGFARVLEFLWSIGATTDDTVVWQVLNQLAKEQGLAFAQTSSEGA